MWRGGVLTISDRGAAGQRQDESGQLITQLFQLLEVEVVSYRIVPDEQSRIEHALVRMCDMERLDLVVTTGGTGLSPRDVTPEATAAIAHKNVPGMAEAMRQAGLAHTPYAMLSRGLCVIRNQTLIINLPGSPQAVQESWVVIVPVLFHALSKLKGDTTECGGSV